MPNFKQFKMGDIFQFESVKQSKSQSDIPTDNSEKGIPYIVQSKLNNMFSRNVNRQWLVDHDEKPIPGNKIVLGVTLPALSYQPLEFGASQVILAYSKELNELNGLYLVTVISKQMVQFSYGNKPGLNVYKNMKIPLPVDKKGKIDFDYMEQRIKELECERIKELSNYLSATGLDNYKLSEKDKSILSDIHRTKEYIIGDIFKSDKGDVDLQNKDIDGKGEIFVNSGSTNYGIKGRTSKDARIFPSNTITIDFFGNAYYRDYNYKMATHNHVFSLSGSLIKNSLVGLYIVGAMSFLKKQFSYNNMATWNKLRVEKIQLPVNDKNEIDVCYMEHYIKVMEKITIKDVVQYKDRVIENTKKVIK